MGANDGGDVNFGRVGIALLTIMSSSINGSHPHGDDI